MKPLSRILAVGALLVASASFAAEQFTGKIDMQMTSAKDKNMTMVYSVKPDATRIDIKGQPMSMIFTPAKKEMVMLMHENKMYMTHTIDVEKMAEKRAEKQGDNVPDIEATGKTDVICGYTCNQYISRDGKNVTELWIAEGLGAYMSFNGGGGGGMFGRKQQSAASAKWEEALKGKGGFPLRVVTQDAKGKETFRMEATKVEKGGVSDADFLPPKDYQAFQMPNLGDLNPFKRR
jgi:hypothetical protein